MSKTSRLNKEKAAKAKANGGGKQQPQEHRNNAQQGSGERSEGAAKKDQKKE